MTESEEAAYVRGQQMAYRTLLGECYRNLPGLAQMAGLDIDGLRREVSIMRQTKNGAGAKKTLPKVTSDREVRLVEAEACDRCNAALPFGWSKPLCANCGYVGKKARP